jgi:hypothetical protein
MTEALCEDTLRVDRHSSARPRRNRRIDAIYFNAVRLVTIRSVPSKPGKAALWDLARIEARLPQFAQNRAKAVRPPLALLGGPRCVHADEPKPARDGLARIGRGKRI